MQTTLTTNTSTGWLTKHDGNVFIQAAGTWGSGTLTVEIKMSDGVSVQAVQDGAFTSGPVSQQLTIPRETPVRLTLAGSAGASIVTQITPSAI